MKKRALMKKQNRIWKMAGLFLVAIVMVFMMNGRIAEAKVELEEIEYEGNGIVDVSFVSDVEYRSLKVTVKDKQGKKVKIQLLEADDDDMKFKLKNVRKGTTYTFKIKGIRRMGEKTFGTLRGKIKIPKTSKGISVERVEYDSEDREVSFEFGSKVEWKNLEVTITDGKKNYVRYVDEEKDGGYEDEIETDVKKLKDGVTYHYMIRGIRKVGDKKYSTIKGSFRL